MSANRGMTVVEVSIVLAILLLIAAISAPALRLNLQKKRAAQCALKLDAIDIACKKYAAEEGGYPQSLSDLVPAYLDILPACPSGGAYAMGTPNGDPPTCSVPGHQLSTIGESP